MSVDKSRYREVNYIGARILQARELNKQQAIDRHADTTVNTYSPSAYELGAIYKEGALMNVTAGTSGTTVTLSATDNTKPMLVFVRGVWEKLKTLEAPTTDLGGSGTQLFLNWELRIRTSADDSDLIDAITSEDTAQMGELILSVSATDTSGTSISGSQLEKNLSPIVLLTFTNSGSAITLVPADDVIPQAQANAVSSGLVKLSTGTASGIACSNDDPRLTDSRTPANLSVVDAKVRVPVSPGGTNADGTTVYNLSSDPGGISAKKIIIEASSQLLEDGWSWLKTTVNNLVSAFTAHATANLGLVNTHPMPTATQVGATPASHQGKPLALPDTHPISVSQDTSGFRIIRNGSVIPASGDFGFSVVEGSTSKAGLGHDGDVFSLLADASSVGSTDGDGARANSGSLGSMSLLAKVVSDHLNKTSHNNPHGLTLGDLGGATITYVDTEDQNILSAALSFATLMSKVAVRKVTTMTPTAVLTWASYGNGVGPGESYLKLNTVRYFNWMIFTFGNAFEIGIGLGNLLNGSSIPMPPSDSNGSWPVTQMIGTAGLSDYLDKNDDNSPSWGASAAWAQQVSDGSGSYYPSTIISAGTESNSRANLDSSGNYLSGGQSLYGSVSVIAYRTITQPPILISLSPSTGTNGTTLTITGRNFGSVIGNATVTIGGHTASVTSCNPTTIVCTVPAGITAGGATVTVTISGLAGVNTLTFIET